VRDPECRFRRIIDASGRRSSGLQCAQQGAGSDCPRLRCELHQAQLTEREDERRNRRASTSGRAGRRRRGSGCSCRCSSGTATAARDAAGRRRLCISTRAYTATTVWRRPTTASARATIVTASRMVREALPVRALGGSKRGARRRLPLETALGPLGRVGPNHRSISCVNRNGATLPRNHSQRAPGTEGRRFAGLLGFASWVFAANRRLSAYVSPSCRAARRRDHAPRPRGC
jgi:hypothetical protein